MFVVYILALTYGMTLFYAKLREHFNPLDAFKEKVTHLEKRVKEERFKHLLTSYEFQEFRGYVATVLPEAIKEKDGPIKNSEKSYPLRGLASVVQSQVNENLALSRAKIIFEEGKKLFREKKYEAASTSFEMVLKKHPYSAYVPEAMFLLVECNFVLRHYDQLVDYANKMLDVYPESELTGYALVRLGKVYELQDRHEDAIDIYKTVMKSFPNRDLSSIASEQLRSIQL